jgi:hypothetical protein
VLQPYPSARAVAPKIYKHFTHCHELEPNAPVAPGIETIEELLNVAFWASLNRQEGRDPKISLAYLPVSAAGSALTFSQPLPFDPETVARVAPAVERPGIHLGVFQNDKGLEVWGTTRSTPSSTFVLEVVEPGMLVIKRRRSDDPGKYANVAVLQGDQIKIIDENTASDGDRRPLMASLLGLDNARSWTDSINVTVQLATSMRAHGRGGTLLIVPDGSNTWKSSIAEPLVYEITPAYDELSALLDAPADQKREAGWRDAVRKAVDVIAGFTGVDGAAIISERYDLLGFGAKIRRTRNSEPVQMVGVSEPLTNANTKMLNVTDIGGTRHLSAAQFAQDQQDALALVASQDGRFTAFAWSPSEAIVRAYRLEALLL